MRPIDPAVWAVPAGWACLVGPVAPLGRGWIVAALGLACGAWVSWRLSAGSDPVGRGISSSRGSGWAADVARVVWSGLSARAFVDVVVAYPAAWWAVPVAIGVGISAWGSGARRVGVVVLGTVLVPSMGVWGARFEAGGVDARGWAFSSEIHGIHPFQTTSVVIDGYGPFDISINDYVEPDGERGYGPEAFGAAMEAAIHRIAEIGFPHGPARAREAFARAEVGVVWDPPIPEHRGDAPSQVDPVPRFFVRSGTVGAGSSVRFVCPGSVIDPEPPNLALPPADCPNKYASEASAGLGVTGRWPGYAEGRGNPRAGLARWLGWTHTDDALGQRVAVAERGLLLGFVLALGGVVARRASRVAALARLSSVWMTALLISALAAVPASLGVSVVPRVRAWEVEVLGTVWRPVGWRGLLAVIALARGGAERGASTWLAWGICGAATWAVASSWSRSAWLMPERSGGAALLGPPGVAGLAEALGGVLGGSLAAWEGTVAAVAAVVALTLVGAAVPPGQRPGVRWGALLVAAGVVGACSTVADPMPTTLAIVASWVAWGPMPRGRSGASSVLALGAVTLAGAGLVADALLEPGRSAFDLVLVVVAATVLLTLWWRPGGASG